MSAPRTARAVLHRLATVQRSSTTISCPHVLRHFSQAPRRAAPEKVQTTSSFQSYPLPTKPPTQPRNDPVTETSIAGPKPRAPQATDTISQSADSAPTQSSAAPAQGPVAIPEQEAQKPKPAPTKRKLKPRKAAIRLTPTAVEHLRALLDQPQPQLIKVGVRNRGCSGLAYNLEYVEKPGPFDEEVVQDGVKVLIDSKALFSIIGSEMDWIEDKLNQRFVFHNPNIKEECGCGESFMV
ncbi:iron-sulfur cluster assembly 1 [Microdochium nivale]|nr:iron-sulfur cluster assembly 1 [Microdochium nivale]